MREHLTIIRGLLSEVLEGMLKSDLTSSSSFVSELRAEIAWLDTELAGEHVQSQSS